MKRWMILLLGFVLVGCSRGVPEDQRQVELEPFLTEIAAQGEAAALSSTPEVTAQRSEGAAPAASPVKWDLWTNGTQLRGANTWQRIVVPRYDGDIFLGNEYIGPPYTQADFDQLAAWGANYVNLSHPGLYTERPPYVLDEQVQANLDEMIEMAAQADLFVVITFRTGPGRNDFTFYRDDDWFDDEDLIEHVWSDLDAQAAWVEMWRHTAARYRDNPVVVGYDLMCEPNANEIVDEWDIDVFMQNYGGSGYDWNSWYPEIVAAIRAVDTQTPILVGGNGYSGLDWLPYLETVEADRIVYTFHQYAPHIYTHQEPGDGLTYPGQVDVDYDGELENFDSNWLLHYIVNADVFVIRYGVPVAVNEFGVVRWAPDAADFMRDEMALFETLGVNYAFWIWDPEWQPWTDNVNFMNYRFGPNPDSLSAVENDLQAVILEYWARNVVRPSSFYGE